MVLSQAIDPTGSGHDFVVEKQATMLAFNKVMRDLARRGSLDGLGGNVVVSAMNSLFSAMGVRLASRKLAQIVPVAGVVVSAGLNAALMRTIGETADHLYRERFLAERLPKVQLVEPEGTYLLWLDFRAYGLEAKALDRKIIDEARLRLGGRGIRGLSRARSWALRRGRCRRKSLRGAVLPHLRCRRQHPPKSVPVRSLPIHFHGTWYWQGDGQRRETVPPHHTRLPCNLSTPHQSQEDSPWSSRPLGCKIRCISLISRRTC